MIIRSSNVSIQRGRDLGNCSAIVLAGGDGTRLRAATTTSSGEVIPKQYCSLGTDSCLVQQAISRAQQIATPDRVWPIVAFGILLGLLTLERAEAASTVLILPADHHVADEAVFLKALRRLTQWSQRDPEGIYLLGAEPEDADPALGYILPWFDTRVSPIGVYEFIERPEAADARKLINRGALWNTFIVAGSRQAFLRAYAPRFAPQIEALREAINRPTGAQKRLEDEYRRLSTVDFSHDIVEQLADTVQVLRLPVCGWTELGSVSKIRKAVTYRKAIPSTQSLFLDLADSSKDRHGSMDQ
jgi:mannose-1-phosphate guanylyltransferase